MVAGLNWLRLNLTRKKGEDMTIAQEIADYVIRTRYADLPTSVLKKAKECILDSIGVAFYGSKFEASQIAFAVICGSDKSSGGTSILGRREKALPSLAAFVNGVMTHVADFDDGMVMFRGHPSAVLMPSALAASEDAGGNGKDLLTAFVVGSEVGGKLGSVMGWEHYEVGWHPTGTIGSISAAAAASKALHLNRDEVVNALGIAASGASGLRINFGTMTKSYHAGHAAMVGVLAAQLARKGFDASPLVLEGDTGFAKSFGCGGDISLVVRNLGTNYALNTILLKPYPSCGATHPPVDAILKIRDQLNSKWEDVTEIEARVRSAFSTVLCHRNPQTPLEAKFSLEFCLSAALVFGQLTIAQFVEASVFNPQVRALMEKVRMIPDPELEKAAREKEILAPARLEVKLRGGKEFCETVLEAKGGSSNPMTQDEIQEKFRGCTDQVLSNSSVETVLDTIEHLEALKNVSELTSILTSKGLKKEKASGKKR